MKFTPVRNSSDGGKIIKIRLVGQPRLLSSTADANSIPPQKKNREYPKVLTTFFVIMLGY